MTSTWVAVTEGKNRHSPTVPERRWRRRKSYGAISSHLTIRLQGSDAPVFIRHPDLDIDPSSFR
ncbi:hypothetical protein GALMADRAFT_800493 [Galerina marginata CBS 339.88]|uniref:Uncharacterized protein n=1 Tax=Galerina marginata (strain CBS 339.88) TaxID=685588 RepID=A0A067SUL2_GALM3|nr:hypothetical protein GALMADRAFT_800493 [Galerina marginata CBS 339.88]